jgi:hypothetical protein
MAGSDRRQAEKSAIGDIRECQRSATSKNEGDFQRERRFVFTVLSQKSKASPLMSRCSAECLGTEMSLCGALEERQSRLPETQTRRPWDAS